MNTTNTMQDAKSQNKPMAGAGWPDLGLVCASYRVNDELARMSDTDKKTLSDCLRRHCERDWGEVCEEDRAANDAALVTGARILSAYTWRGEKIWIITEAVGDDGLRAATTILYPSEY